MIAGWQDLNVRIAQNANFGTAVVYRVAVDNNEQQRLIPGPPGLHIGLIGLFARRHLG
jgi:hypothetical protein